MRVWVDVWWCEVVLAGGYLGWLNQDAMGCELVGSQEVEVGS